MNIGRKVNYNGIMKVDILSPKQAKCPICHMLVEGILGEHIRQEHGEEQFRQAVLKEKEKGTPDPEIGLLFGITFKQLENIITQTYGINISVLKKPRKIKQWKPKDFKEETTTVWSFKQRGNWATHDGRYRGNWSPYIPRNVILKYSKPGDVVLDYFVGGGTTAVEAKLLGRKCIARDINPAAIGLTLENLKFDLPQSFKEKSHFYYEPEVSVGDARDLSDIPDESIDLICAHPPYAGIISYSSKVEGDLSKLSVEQFLVEMGKVAKESFRVLKPGGKCAILIGDARKHKHVVPIGFRTIRVFLEKGFVLKELAIKRQHNCKTTGFWYDRSIKYNFLLLAHEYLPIFEKPAPQSIAALNFSEKEAFSLKASVKEISKTEKENLETTTVWIFPPEKIDEEIRRNLLGRFAKPETKFMEIRFDEKSKKLNFETENGFSLVYVSPPKELNNKKDIVSYRDSVEKIAEKAESFLSSDSFFVIDTRDVRINGLVYPTGVFLLEDILKHKGFKIKEIIVVTPNGLANSTNTSSNANLKIIHRYLLVFVKK